MRTRLYIGDQTLDIFQDETIEVVSAVFDIQDISKNKGDFSRTFTVPASDKNNKIFKFWWNYNIINGFDARTKVPGWIELEGVPFKIGKWRLLDVQVQKGRVLSYTLNFFGLIVDIPAAVQDDQLTDLDLTDYDHDYDSANVLEGLRNGLFSGAMVYTLMAKKQYYYNSDPNDNVQTPEISNIAFGGGSDVGVIWSDLRPSLQLIKIIEAIEAKYGLTFTRDFFGTDEFTGLYMFLNPSADTQLGGDTQIIDWDGGSSVWINFVNDIGSYDVFNTTGPNDRTYFSFLVTIFPEPGYENVEWTLRQIRNNGGQDITHQENIETGNVSVASDYWNLAQGNVDETWLTWWTIQTNQEFKFTAQVVQTNRNSSGPFGIIQQELTTASSQTIDSLFITKNNLPELGILDLLTGLFQAFKLVVIPQNDGTIYVDTLTNYYAIGKVHDLSDYLDWKKITVKRGKILNRIDYNFQEPQTILNEQFQRNVGEGYGDEGATITDENGDLLDGEQLRIELPFEQIIYERLSDLNTNPQELQNFQYASIIDLNRNPANPKAHLHYVENLSVFEIAFRNDNNDKLNISTSIFSPFHTDTPVAYAFSFLFGTENSTWDGEAIESTLYRNHHERYVLSLFNKQKREYDATAYLPMKLARTIELNDVIKIKDWFFRINRITTELTRGMTNLSLVNVLDGDLDQIIVQRSVLPLSNNENEKTIQVTNLSKATIQKQDLGFGVNWVTIKIGGITELQPTASDLVLTINANPLQGSRRLRIDLIGPKNSESIYIEQFPGSISGNTSFDSTIITLDSTSTTWDET